ncbi:hypothetical protein Tco_0425149 [Tanacetum coccineum]
MTGERSTLGLQSLSRRHERETVWMLRRSFMLPTRGLAIRIRMEPGTYKAFRPIVIYVHNTSYNRDSLPDSAAEFRSTSERLDHRRQDHMSAGGELDSQDPRLGIQITRMRSGDPTFTLRCFDLVEMVNKSLRSRGICHDIGKYSKKKTTDKYCPQGKSETWKSELWNLKDKGNDVRQLH